MQTNLIQFLIILSLMAFSFESSAQVQKKSLNELKWLEGTWIGKNEDGSKFTETYNYISDSLIKITYFFDAEKKDPTNYGNVVIDNGRVYHTFDNSKWILEDDKDGVFKFSPIKNATNKFNWSYLDANSWKAVLIYEDGKRTTYIMKRQ